MDESETVLSGLVDVREKEVTPCLYSHIRINPVDSLIMCCSAGVRENSDDDIFNYEGKKIGSYRRHVEMATKKFIIHRIFEPKEHFLIYNIETKTEKNLQASEVHFFENDEILIRIKDDWYVYDLLTDHKKPKQY
jgi:catabolite regulation protein CreA